MKQEEYFLAGRIYQYALNTIKKTEENNIIINFGVGKDYDLIKIIQILDKKLNRKAVFVVEPLDYGCELIIHIYKKDLIF